MEEENMKQNSVKAPYCEPVGPFASTTMHKTMSMEYEEHSLDKPIREAFPSVISFEFVLYLISAALSVISAVITVVFSLILFAARLLTVSLTATSNWLLRTMEKLNGKGEGRESDASREKTNNFLKTSFSGNDKETGQSNSTVRRIEETNNPNQHGNYIEDHKFDTCASESANFADSGYAIDNCYNNFGEGEQDYSYSEINSSTSKDSHNNYASGLQAFSDAKIWASTTNRAFNNKSLRPQTYRGARIGVSNERNVAIRDAYNNGKNGTQNYDGHIFTQRKIRNEHQSPK